MKKIIAGLIGAVGTLAAMSPSHAAPGTSPVARPAHAAPYADVLRPDAGRAVRTVAPSAAEAPARVIPAQYYERRPHHDRFGHYRRPAYGPAYGYNRYAYDRRPFYRHHYPHRRYVGPGAGVYIR